MRQIIVYAAFMLLAFPNMSDAQNRVYKAIKKCSFEKANKRGLDLGVFAHFPGGGTAEVRMFTADDYTTGGRDDKKSLIYGTFSSGNPATHGQLWHIQYDNCGGLISDLLCHLDLKNTTFTEKSTDYKDRLKVAAKRQNESWFSWDDFDVVIELELKGNAQLKDIDKIAVPGVEILQSSDFSILNHCDMPGNKNTAFCKQLNNVRSISNRNSTDLVIQAHRGIWGRDKGAMENTLAAIVRAKDRGLFLVESDIMPYGITEYKNPDHQDFAKPAGLACFHDYRVNRLTDSKSDSYFFEMQRDEIKQMHVRKARSNEVGSERVLLFDDLMKFIGESDMMLCVDMKNLLSNGSGKKCKDVCLFDNKDYQTRSLMLNLKLAIEIGANVQGKNYLKHMVIKTYVTYDEIRENLLEIGLNESLFDQVLWAPMIASSKKWEYEPKRDKNRDGKNDYDPAKMKEFLDGWFAHDEVVLYYETNFFNDFDLKTSVLLDKSYWKTLPLEPVNAMEYIYLKTGKRAGIFSEEPVGSRGVVNRWGKWKMKNPQFDRRGDHLWMLSHPFMRHAVYTTERVDVWEQIKD